MTFKLTAHVDQIVTKEVQLLVEARSEEEAEEKARQALADYPGPVSAEGIRRIVNIKSHYWIPKSIEFSKIVKVRG